MKEQLLDIFGKYPEAAVLISLLVSILVALLGLIPSVFITAANIYFFGFRDGLMISLAGEALGAIIAFVLYRSGFQKLSHDRLAKYPRILKVVDSEGKDAFVMILALRLIPFVPSGLITFAAAIGRVSAPVFFLASTIGKIPSLLLEAYSVVQIAAFNWQGKILLIGSALGLLFWIIWSKRKKIKKP
jgi:uncharacterized membrane protein YdjX (TVP38/TMEM64 family)